MEIKLKRLKKYTYDDLLQKTIDDFEINHTISIDNEEVERFSELVLVSGKTITLNYDIDEYKRIVESDEPTYKKLAQIGMMLHKDTKDIDGTDIPTNILYESEVWAYLSLTIFKDVVKKLRLDDDEKMTADKIKRFIFNAKANSRSGLSRTGLLFVWSMIDILASEDNENMSIVAFHFVDPVKAIYERAMSKNPIVLRAFVQAIINNKEDARIKNKKYKTKVPNNMSCYARMNILDVYSYDELVSMMTEKIKEVLSVS